MSKITLQISTAPTDVRFLKRMLRHQLKTVGDQVDQVAITADIRPSKKGRFSFDEKQIALFKQILQEFSAQNNSIQVHYVDYDKKTVGRVAEEVWSSGDLPVKDYRGGPFYSYIYGLYRVETDYVFHLDSDIFLGGGSTAWCDEAIELLKNDPKLAIVKPLSGPPKKDGSAPFQSGEALKPYRDHSSAYYSDNFTTRIFFTEKSRLTQIFKNTPIEKPDILRSLIGKWQGNPAVRAPEQLLSTYLSGTEFCRLDYLGTEPGLWALHPPFRSEEFYSKLDDIIEAVENNKVPDAQRGHYDINHAFVDWSSAIDSLPVYRRKKARRHFQ